MTYLLSNGKATPQGRRQPNDLGHQCIEGKIFFKCNASHDSLHLWYAGTCSSWPFKSKLKLITVLYPPFLFGNHEQF